MRMKCLFANALVLITPHRIMAIGSCFYQLASVVGLAADMHTRMIRICLRNEVRADYRVLAIASSAIHAAH